MSAELGLGAVIGNGPLIALLRRLLTRNRLPHAVLLEGRRGTGRHFLAQSLAASVLCHNPQDGDACGVCQSCLQYASGVHPDVIALPHETAAARVKIDDLREEIMARIGETPLLGTRRAVIIPGFDRLNLQSVNALLKILEEPNPAVTIILTVMSADALLRTIRSRAQLFRMQPLTVAEMTTVIEKELGVTAYRAQEMALASGGDLRVARGLKESAIPVDALGALVMNGANPPLVGDLIRQLEIQGKKRQEAHPDSGETEATSIRATLNDWLAVIVESERPKLREEESTELGLARIGRILRAQADLGLNLAPRLVLESLALP